MVITKSQRRRQRQHLGLFWTLVMQAIMIYNNIRRQSRHLPRTPYRNWSSKRQMTQTRMSRKWRTKLCPRYDELETILRNDVATREHSVTKYDDFYPIPAMDESINEVDSQNEDTNPSKSNASKRDAEGGTNKSRRRRTHPMDESLIALSSIVESSKRIANAMKIQATLDKQNHINWQRVLEKLQGMKIDKQDIMQLMKEFRTDESFARMFMNLTDEAFMRDLVFEKLGRDPPSLL